jgi:hypothetical protein
MPSPFNGVIDLEIRNSKAVWSAFLDPTARKEAANVLAWG